MIDLFAVTGLLAAKVRKRSVGFRVKNAWGCGGAPLKLEDGAPLVISSYWWGIKNPD